MDLERQIECRIDRRAFLRRVLIPIGLGVGIGSGTDLVFNIKNIIDAREKAKREVEAQGVTRPDKEALNISAQIHTKSAQYKLEHRDELDKALNLQAQEDTFKARVDVIFSEKMDKRPSGKRLVGDVVGLLLGIQTKPLALIFLSPRETVERPAQNQMLPQRPYRPHTEESYRPVAGYDPNAKRKLEFEDNPSSVTLQQQPENKQVVEVDHPVAGYNPNNPRPIRL